MRSWERALKKWSSGYKEERSVTTVAWHISKTKHLHTRSTWYPSVPPPGISADDPAPILICWKLFLELSPRSRWPPLCWRGPLNWEEVETITGHNALRQVGHRGQFVSSPLYWVIFDTFPTAFWGADSTRSFSFCEDTAKMGHSNVWFSHPRTYGPGSRSW